MKYWQIIANLCCSLIAGAIAYAASGSSTDSTDALLAQLKNPEPERASRRSNMHISKDNLRVPCLRKLLHRPIRTQPIQNRAAQRRSFIRCIQWTRVCQLRQD